MKRSTLTPTRKYYEAAFGPTPTQGEARFVASQYDRAEQALANQILTDPVLCEQCEQMSMNQFLRWVQEQIPHPALKQSVLTDEEREKRHAYNARYFDEKLRKTDRRNRKRDPFPVRGKLGLFDVEYNANERTGI